MYLLWCFITVQASMQEWLYSAVWDLARILGKTKTTCRILSFPSNAILWNLLHAKNIKVIPRHFSEHSNGNWHNIDICLPEIPTFYLHVSIFWDLLVSFIYLPLGIPLGSDCPLFAIAKHSYASEWLSFKRFFTVCSMFRNIQAKEWEKRALMPGGQPGL